MAQSDDDFWGSLGAQTGDKSPPVDKNKVLPGPRAPATPATDDFWSTLGAGGNQTVSSGDSTPVSKSLQGPISEGNIPGIGVQAAASMATDPEQRRRIVAAQLFPDLKPLDAQSRVFFGPNGRMAAVGPDNKAFYVDPSPAYSPDVFRPSTWLPDNALARVGTYAGPALAAAGATAGGALTAPESLIAGPFAAAAGAATGDVIRQSAATYLDPGVVTAPPGTPTTAPYNFGQTALEAGGAAAGQAAMGSILRLRGNPVAANPLDVRALRDPAVQQRIADNYARAKAQGIDLTPGQASGLPSLLNTEDVFASGSLGGEGANIAKQYFDNQRNQLIQGFDRAQDSVSPAADRTDAALQFQQGAEDAKRIVRQQGNTAARPFYQAAEQGGQVMSPDLAQLMDAPAMKTAMDAARKDYANLYRAEAPDTPDFNLWNLTKQKLDDAYTVAQRAGENTTASALDSLRKDVLTHLDTAYPTYGQARATTAPFQRQSARLDATVGSAIGDGTERARAIMAPVFESNNPRAITESRNAFFQAGRGDEWNAGTRAYVQDLFDKTVQSQDGLNPAMLRRQIWSDPNKRAAIQAAMDPTAFQGFENFMRTVEDVAKSRGANSLTAGRQAGASEVTAQAGATLPIRTVGILKGLSIPRMADVFGKTADTIQGAMTGRNIDTIGRRLFSPEGQQYLKAMGNAPKANAALALTARFLGEQGGAFIAAPPQPTNALEMAH